MIKLEQIGDGVLKVVAPAKLQSGDFAELAKQIEPIIRQKGRLRLLIDASRLTGWKDLAALEEHAAFVKSHQEKVERRARMAAMVDQCGQGVPASRGESVRKRPGRRSALLARELTPAGDLAKRDRRKVDAGSRLKILRDQRNLSRLALASQRKPA